MNQKTRGVSLLVRRIVVVIRIQPVHNKASLEADGLEDFLAGRRASKSIIENADLHYKTYKTDHNNNNGITANNTFY